MSTTIRVSKSTRDRFSALARQTGRPMTQLLEEAADSLERDLFFTGFERGFEALRDDEAAWFEMSEERRAEESSLSDGSS
jgi:predicted transcriptional regulator